MRPAATRASKLSGMRSFKLGQSRRNAGSGRRRAVSSPRLVSHPIRWLRAVRAVSRNIRTRIGSQSDPCSFPTILSLSVCLSLSLSLSPDYLYNCICIWPNTNPVSNVGISYVTRVRSALPSNRPRAPIYPRTRLFFPIADNRARNCTNTRLFALIAKFETIPPHCTCRVFSRYSHASHTASAHVFILRAFSTAVLLAFA